MITWKVISGQTRFINVMEYKAVDEIPNYEAGVWEKTKERRINEGLNDFDLHWDWFYR